MSEPANKKIDDYAKSLGELTRILKAAERVAKDIEDGQYKARLLKLIEQGQSEVKALREAVLERRAGGEEQTGSVHRI